MNSPDPTSQINLALFACCVVHLQVPLSIKLEVHPRIPAIENVQLMLVESTKLFEFLIGTNKIKSCMES